MISFFMLIKAKSYPELYTNPVSFIELRLLKLSGRKVVASSREAEKSKKICRYKSKPKNHPLDDIEK